MKDRNLTTSAVGRLYKLGKLAGRVATSRVGNVMANYFRPEDIKDERLSLNLKKNAARMVETLGNLKGVPMKIGQMLSLHAAFLPPEVTNALSVLQQNAPAVSFNAIIELIREELGQQYNLIENISPEPYAAASIGQVHQAVLKDGREVVFKVQYPGIDDVIIADLKNLKGVLNMVFSMFTKMDMELVWRELNDRLKEELDYEQEADHIRQMHAHWKDDKDIIIPEVIDDLSRRHVLCMPILKAIPPEQILSEHIPQDLRDKWGQGIFKFFLKGLFQHRFLHVDPNLANFAFLDDGRIIVYDFGCMKKIPKNLARGYARLSLAVLAGNYGDLPLLLKEMGVENANGDPIQQKIALSFAEIIQEPFREAPIYRFGGDNAIYKQMIAHAKENWYESMDLIFPQDIIFIDRTIGGHLGNLSKLQAAGPWRNILYRYAESILASHEKPRPPV